MASGGEPGNFYYMSVLSIFLKELRYYRAFSSVTKDLSSSVGVPINENIRASWSLEFIGNPLLVSWISLSLPGESGKHCLPGNNGFLSRKVTAFS